MPGKTSIIWTEASIADLQRVYDFLKIKNKSAAKRTIHKIRESSLRLLTFPNQGERLKDMDVRVLYVLEYEICYEIYKGDVYIVRVFHTREDRMH